MPRGGKQKRPAKHPNVLGYARQCLSEGRYLDTRHAAERKEERDITLLEICQVIEAGWHERRKDEYKVEHQSWSYAIRGKTIDKRELRVAVAFDDETGMLIITTIDLFP